MLDEVRAGRRVCGAVYGHPGVFAEVPHRAIAKARRSSERSDRETPFVALSEEQQKVWL